MKNISMLWLDNNVTRHGYNNVDSSTFCISKIQEPTSRK